MNPNEITRRDVLKASGLLGRAGSIGLQIHSGNGWPKGAKIRSRDLRSRESSCSRSKVTLFYSVRWPSEAVAIDSTGSEAHRTGTMPSESKVNRLLDVLDYGDNVVSYRLLQSALSKPDSTSTVGI